MENKLGIGIWLDDKRDPFEKDWKEWILKYAPIKSPCKIIWIKCYKEFVEYITNNGLPNFICFDNDIADFTGPDGTELRGVDCAKWLLEYCLDNNLELPLYAIQSSNYNAREFIDGIFKSFNNRHNK